MAQFKLALLTILGIAVAQQCAAQESAPPLPSENASASSHSLATFTLFFPSKIAGLTGTAEGRFRYAKSRNLLLWQTATKVSKTPSTRVKRTAIDPSMVGYIEDSRIQTVIRIRFDAAVHADAPDRAEFFYAKCGCYRGLVGTTSYDPDSPGPGTDVPRYVNFQQLYFQGEYAVKPRLSFFSQLPLRWLEPHSFPGKAAAFSDAAGIGDVHLGMKVGLLASPSTSLTFMLRGLVPSGDSRRGLGTAHGTVEPSILIYQRIQDRVSVEAELGDYHPIGGALGAPTTGPRFAGDVLHYGLGSSYSLMEGERFRLAPVVEFVGWHIFGGQATNQPSPDGINIVNVKIGPRMSFGLHNSLYVGYGVALTSQNWYREIFRTEYRYAF